MREKIAMGFHATVDFELEWDTDKFVRLIRDYEIRDWEIRGDIQPDSERSMLIIILAHMREGSGAEFTPDTNDLCVSFAEHFVHRQTLGGTATRAAMAINRLGYGCELAVCCFNRLVREGLPVGIRCFSNVGKGREDIYPHTVFTYPGGIRIQANDIDFVTPRENRILFSNDEESKEMAVSQDFLPCMSDAKVFLLGCFSEVLDFEILRKRMEETKALLMRRNPDTLLVLEDGCYIQKDFRSYVHREILKCRLDILSMNEDELQEQIGKRFDILNVQVVLEALEACRKSIGVPLLVVHSSKWAVAYGENAESAESARLGLDTGINLAAAHFCYGSDFKKDEYRYAATMAANKQGEAFCKEMEKIAGDRVCALPTKNLSQVKKPTVVGLGDCFAGGLALGLTEKELKV